MGARIIEKHFTLNKSYKGPDHAASSLPSEFKKIVDEVDFINNFFKFTW